MNILHTEASPGWGGQEIRILREAEGMRAAGRTVIFAVMKGGKLIEEARSSGFIVYELNFQKWAWLWTFLRMICILKRHRIALVNTHSSLDSWLGGIVAWICRIPNVRTRHLSTPVRPGLNSRILYGFLPDFVVTTCEAIIPAIASQSKRALDTIRSIPTGVDPKRMQFSQQECQKFRENFSINSEDFLVGTACFMRSWKGILDFLQAAQQLRDVPRLRWVIIGGGHEEKYRQRAKDLNLEGIVFFTGHLPYPIHALNALDVFALLSTAHEGVSQAVLQAAFLSKPLISTNIGGLSEVCIDNETGISVPTFSPTSVAQAVLRLMHNPILCKDFGTKARERVLEKFMMDRTVSEMKKVYDQVLAEKDHFD